MVLCVTQAEAHSPCEEQQPQHGPMFLEAEE